MNFKKLWIAFAAVTVLSFAVLGFFGVEIYHEKPPIPQKVVTTDGQVLFSGQDILDGQNVWQGMGGQEMGSIWGHGAYLAPDWSADWLHRELVKMLDTYGVALNGLTYDLQSPVVQATLREQLREEYRKNTYNAQTGELVLSPERAEAIKEVGDHYAGLFGNDPAKASLRDAYSIPANVMKSAENQRLMNSFFFWTAWSCATQRPGKEITYTNNWPSEPLIGNRPTSSAIIWSVISFVLLLGGIGALSWYFAVQDRKGPEEIAEAPASDPLLALNPTPSMKATLKYFWVVMALAVVQILLGAITAHYGVEGQGFYGIPLAKYLPYTVTRTWHLQLGIFWIATAWLATGLFVAPAVSGMEPKFQRLGVNVLFVALLVIVVGSLVGQWISVVKGMGFQTSFWFGHMGYEYVDLGRFWQIFLFAGLFIWLFLMNRAMYPAFKKPTGNRHLLILFFIASAAIALFYGAALMWGRQTHLSMAEYWRWWVVHLWVEGFFEVFATVVIAFLFTRMGLLKESIAASAVLFSTVIFLGGGIIGTFHHLYFSGTPTAVLALGATFSALEVVPLVLVGFEAYKNLTLSRMKPWIQAYRWPIYFFVAVAFWNLVGAGLFGFLINPPVALYYMQSLNTTPVHGHTALFGVYGMLGFGLMLFCLRGLTVRKVWKTGALSFAFWSINIGLLLMVTISILPQGLMQTWASVEHGLWYARSAEFLHTGLMDTLRWLRVIGDTIFAAGVISLGWFVLGLKTGWSLSKEDSVLEPMAEKAKLRSGVA
ncbi:MAG TPA: nitric-oxide reductase large subunit [bacterium]|jgi:nitric oxide reductase subunit B